MARIKYSTGDEVAHLDNLELKMRVRKLVYNEKKLQHISCDWWTNNELNKENFHSHELILWSIASQGKEQVDSYLKSLESQDMLNNIQKNNF